MSDSKYYILYRCIESLDSDIKGTKVFKGDDLANLALFYAGTTHKMQGSQAKLIISPLGNVNYTGFITRNMMYTLYTRAVKQVFTLGSVGVSRGSMLSRARREVSGGDTMTVGELLYK